MKRILFYSVLILGLVACGGSNDTSDNKTLSDTSYATTDLRSKDLINPAAYIVPQCYTVTQPEAASPVYNPCYTCHTSSVVPNYVNDQELQMEYSFPDDLLKNPWTNIFVDRSTEVSAISDTEIIDYIRTDNYMDETGHIVLTEKLNNLALNWDFDEDGIWDGYTPDCRFDFDTEGFDRSGSKYTGWRAFAYASFPSTFWPTNGSINDVLIRLGEDFQKDQNGLFDLNTYKINLAIIEALVTRRNVLLDSPIDETEYDVDLNRDGELNRSQIIAYDWSPGNGREMNYVGQAKIGHENGRLHLAAGLFPEGTEFLHTVRYVDIDDTTGAIKLSPRIKELRYAVKRTWQTYSDLLQAALEEIKENHDFPNRTRQLLGNVEQGMNNDQGWLYQGFIEDNNGDLRPQTYEETAFCIGCHSGIGATVDGIFSFPRKLAADRTARQGWYHWSQINRQGTVEPMVEIENAGVQYEYSFYLMYNGAGDEFRNNGEVIKNFFDETGQLKELKQQALHDDVSLLLYPSRERALEMAKSYRVIVAEQSFIYGRDATTIPPLNVHKTITEGQLTGIKQVTNKGSFINALGPVRAIQEEDAIVFGSDQLNELTGGHSSPPDSTHYQIDSEGFIYPASYSLAGVDFGFSFPPRLPLPTRQLVPNGDIEPCYRCHRLPSPMPSGHPAATPPMMLPERYGTEEYTLTQLTFHDSRDCMPVSSPIGDILSWVSTRSGPEQIWLMDNDGSNQRQLSPSINIQGWQRFSPDGTKIAFWEYDQTTQTHMLRVASLDGTVTTLDSGISPIERPVFTPDGNHLAYAKQIDNNWDIWIISIDGTTRYQLTRSPDMETSPWFNPDGIMAFKVAPTGEYGLTVERFMTFERGYDNPQFYSWDGPHSVQLSDMSNDGGMIAFTAEAISSTSGKDRVSYLAVLSDLVLDGDTARATNKRLISKSATLGDRGVMISPDSTKAVFWSLNQNGRAGLWLYDIESELTIPLTTEGFDLEPVWTDNGQSIVFTSTRGTGQYDIWKLDL
jgi:WD40-like Beta Propeller Repeat